MQYKYIISAFLRGLSRDDHGGSGKCVTAYPEEQYGESPHSRQQQQPPPHDVVIPDDISLDAEPDPHLADAPRIVRLLEAVRSGYGAGQAEREPERKAGRQPTVALRINDIVYLIHPPSAARRGDERAGAAPAGVMHGRIALITGAAQGLGKGIAAALAARGALVYIADINIDQAERTAAELRTAHSTDAVRVLPIQCADEQSVRACAQTVIREVGGIDTLICNAGIIVSGDVETLAADDFSKITAINYYGYFLLVKYFSPCMKYQHQANSLYYTDIIQINSKSGLQGSLNNSAYAGSKFGGIGLTQSFALELVKHNIKVNAICPGNFYDGPLWSDPKTGLFAQYLAAGKVPHARTVADVRAAYEARTPMGRGVSVDDIVKGVIYLIDQTFETGQALPISGGQVMLH